MDPVRTLLDRQAVVDTIVRLFVGTDERDWPAVEKCFADPVRFDMTSMTGGEPQDLSPGRIVSGWEEGLRSLEAIHHQAGNFQVSVAGDEATASCYAIATHYRRVASGRNTRTFVGTYEFHLVRDRRGGFVIDLFRFRLKYVDGNPGLHAEPAAG